MTATAVDAAGLRPTGDGRRPPRPRAPSGALPSLYQPGHMRRRLDQLIETNRRYGHPFGLAVFDVAGPGDPRRRRRRQETVLAVVGAALRDSVRLVDESLPPRGGRALRPRAEPAHGRRGADGERLLRQLDELERAGGCGSPISAGVVACPEHGADAEQLLHKADAAMWRARAVGQPVGVGALQDR